MSLVYPDRRSAVYVPLELDGTRGRLVAEAAHSDPSATIFWHLDEHYLARTEGHHRLALEPAPGDHILTLIDSHGEVLRRPFTVLAREGRLQRPDAS